MNRKGTSLIDLVISMGILAILFGGIYLVYFSILTAIANINIRAAASTAIGDELETIRNMSYDSVGTVGGVPSGSIAPAQSVTIGAYTFTLSTTIRNIDDPFDGTLGGNPNDTAPADYKLISIDATCPLCNTPLTVEITTTVAPKNLESATQNGSLFLYAVDANGNPISGATMQVVNTAVSPSINLTDTTNVNGVLELVGVPTSTQNYMVITTKNGYTTDQTYTTGAAGNPNPVKPNLTVAAQTVTAATFVIDKTSQLSVYASDDRCVPIANEPFSITGSKLIGTNPDVLKFSTSSFTQSSGSPLFPAMEWDTYTLTLTDANEISVGTIPLDPITIIPSSTASFRFVLRPAANPSLLVTVVDAGTGAGIADATTTIAKSGFSETLVTDHASLSQADWSGTGSAGYASQSGGIDPFSTPGQLTLLADASGTYATGTTAWLVSNTFDVGGTASQFYAISWNPTTQPAQTGAGSLAFQVAGNNDNATWNFVGPDGRSTSYFTSPGPLPASLAGDRYFRYEVYLSTQDPNFTPELNSVSFDFTADCVPLAQTLFTGLSQGTYSVTVTAPNYTVGSTTVSVGSGFQSSTISLVPM